MAIICTILKSSIDETKQDSLLDSLLSRLTEEYPDQVISVDWGTVTEFTNTDESFKYVNTTLPLKGPGLLQDIVIFG